MNRHQIGNIISVMYSAIRLSVMKFFYGNRLKTSLIERISPNVVIDIDSTSKLFLKDRVRIHSGSRITAAKGGIVEIGENVRINNNCRIACRNHVVIEEEVEFGPGVLIYDHDHQFNVERGVIGNEYKTDPIKIGKNSWIGANVIILRGTEIGKNCVVGAGSVIKGKYGDNCLIYQERITKIKGIE